MRSLVLMRGAPGCGKSTFIEEHSLTPYTLSPDLIRVMHESPCFSINGDFSISQKNDKDVWSVLFSILEKRMEKGNFTVIDATNGSSKTIDRYVKLAGKYRYNILCVDFTDIPIDIVKARNIKRGGYKIVPEDVIDRMFENFANNCLPKSIKTIKPHEFDKSIMFNKIDFTNKYKKIHHIGDIHGCFSVLNKFFEMNGISDDELYIFTGDYCDRGIENDKVVEYIISLSNRDNFIFIEGNHEIHLEKWCLGEPSSSAIFNEVTKEQLDSACINKSKCLDFYRKLQSLVYYSFNGFDVVVTHGGIPNIVDNFTYISDYYFIKGVGGYEDFDTVAKSFIINTKENCFSVHGHRNINSVPIDFYDRVFNLEGFVEGGGFLRIATLTSNGFKFSEIKNDVWNKR